MALTESEKGAREGKLGSSDAAIVAGVSPYKTPLALYYSLRGDLPRYSDEETEAQEIGKLAEPMLAELFTKRTGMNVRRTPTRLHPKHLWMVAHLDYEIVGGNQGPGVLELKMRDRSGQRDWDEGIPDDISLQVAHQLAVTNREWARVAVLFGGNTFKIYELQRDKELEDYLITIEQQFLVRVEKGEPPDADWEKDHSVIKRLYPSDSGTVVALDNEEVRTVCQELIQAKASLKDLDTYKDAAEAYLKDHMKDASEATVPGWGTITWKNNKPSQVFDKERFEKENADLYQKYLTERPGARVFRLKPKKELVA